MPQPPNTQFEYTTTFLQNISISHLFTLNPAHYQFSTTAAISSSIYNISHEKSGTHFRFIHNMKNKTLKFVSIFSKKDGPYAQTEFLYSQPDYQINLKHVLPAFDNRKIYVLNLFKSINRRLCMGLEAVCDGSGIGGSLYGRLDIGTILYGRIDREEKRIGFMRKVGMLTYAGEIKKGNELSGAIGIKLETLKANVHVGVENMMGRIEVEQRMGQNIGFKMGSEIDLKTGNQSIGISINFEN